MRAKIKADPPAHLQGRGKLNSLFEELIQLDQLRVQAQIVDALSDRKWVSITISEVLYYPQVVACEEVLVPISNLLLTLFQEGDLSFPGFPAGLFFFAFHKDDAIRQWAVVHIEQAVENATTQENPDVGENWAEYRTFISLADMSFTMDYVANWIHQLVARGVRQAPSLSPLSNLIAVSSDAFWTSLFRLLDNLSAEDLDEVFPSVILNAESAANNAEEAGKSSASLLDDILNLLTGLGKKSLALQLIEVLLARVEPQHMFWFKTKLMPGSVLKLIAKEFVNATDRSAHGKWFELAEAIGLTIQSAYRRCDIIEPAIRELFVFLVEIIQDSAATPDETKLEAAFIFARVFESWRRNPTSINRADGEGADPSVALRPRWAPLLVRYLITQSPVISVEARDFVGRVIATQLSNDATSIVEACASLLNGLNKLLTQRTHARSSSFSDLSSQSNQGPSVATPADLRVVSISDLWYNTTACCGSLTDPVHAAILTAFRDLSLLDLDYCGGLVIDGAPYEWKQAHSHLRNLLAQFKSYQKIYFGAANQNKYKRTS